MSFNVRIESIILDKAQKKRYKKLSEHDSKIHDLTASISDVGQLEPIIINSSKELINGLKRIFIYENILNKKTIIAEHPANKDIEGTDLGIAKIDVSLLGPDPSFWEVGKMAHDRVKLFQEKHPEFPIGAGKKPAVYKDVEGPIAELIRVTGISNTSIHDCRQIYESFTEGQAEYLQDNEFNKTQALKMCRWPVQYRDLFISKLMGVHAELPQSEKLTKDQRETLMEGAEGVIENIHSANKLKAFKKKESSARITREIAAFETLITRIKKRQEAKESFSKAKRYLGKDEMPVIASGSSGEGVIGKILSSTVSAGSGFSILGLQEIRNSEREYGFFRYIGSFKIVTEALRNHLTETHNSHYDNKKFKGVWLLRPVEDTPEKGVFVVRENGEQKISKKQLQSVLTLKSSIIPFLPLD